MPSKSKPSRKSMHQSARSTHESARSLPEARQMPEIEPQYRRNWHRNYFQKLPNSVIGYVRASVRNGKALRLKYFPSKTVPNRIGWRTVLPIDYYSRRGTTYFLVWFVSGSSYNGLTGYRLLIVDNIQEIEYLDNFPIMNIFSDGSVVKHDLAKISKHQAYQIFDRLYRTDQIE